MKAFLLLKPDCLRRGLVRRAERAIARAGLRIDCRHQLSLSAADTRVLWPEYTDDGHVLTRAFLDRYLSGGPAEVLTVSGPDAFSKAREAKRSIRGRYALGPFANLVHAAEVPGELARQGEYLGGRCSSCSSAFGMEPVSPVPVRPVGFDFRSSVDIPRLVDEVWPRLQVDLVAPPPFRLEEIGVEWALYLGADRGQTLDSGVTAVWRALPGVELGHALMLTLYAGRVGGYPIAVGGRDAVEKAHRVLVGHGVRACGTGPFGVVRFQNCRGACPSRRSQSSV